MTDQEIDALVIDIEETVCEFGHITEPAGSGCGYGISDEGEAALTELLKSKLKKT